MNSPPISELLSYNLYEFFFGKLAVLLNKRFKIRYKSFFESIPVQKTVLEGQKRGFFLLCILVGRPIEGAILPPLATLPHQAQSDFSAEVQMRFWRLIKLIMYPPACDNTRVQHVNGLGENTTFFPDSWPVSWKKTVKDIYSTHS